MHEVYSTVPHIRLRCDALLITSTTMFVHMKHVLIFEESQDYRVTFICVYF